MISNSLVTRILMFVAVVLILPGGGFGSESAVAQGQSVTPPSPTLVDGSLEPDRIPDWILWRELFLLTLKLREVSPSQGTDYLVERMNLDSVQVEHLLSHAKGFVDEELKMQNDARRIVSDARGNISDSVRARLKQMQTDKENRILAIRDLLRSRIGADAISRMQSFVRLQIAPGIKIGRLEPGSQKTTRK